MKKFYENIVGFDHAIRRFSISRTRSTRFSSRSRRIWALRSASSRNLRATTSLYKRSDSSERIF